MGNTQNIETYLKEKQILFPPNPNKDPLKRKIKRIGLFPSNSFIEKYRKYARNEENS